MLEAWTPCEGCAAVAALATGAVPAAVGATGPSSRGTESGEGRLGIASARTPARSSSTTDNWR